MEVPASTNLRTLRPSREKRDPGDFFAYEMPDGLRRYGRLISRSVAVGLNRVLPVLHLVYFYAGDSVGEFHPARLSCSSLLIPPLVVNQKPWTLGLFERVARIPLKADDVLPVHCFHDIFRNRYFDELGRELPRRIEPCGHWSMCSYQGVDNELSAALGFRPAADGLA